jgi:peroxiredoxin Q/BCP
MIHMPAELREGDPAPDFSLPSTTGATISLHDFRGHDVILYFYPKDDTPGCTKEACDFRDAHDTIGRRNAIVLGISPDGVSKHDRFATKFDLPFPLLADTDHAIADAYGAWGERNYLGRRFDGILRSTFLIDKEGKIRKIWRQVKVDGHAEEVVEAISS